MTSMTPVQLKSHAGQMSQQKLEAQANYEIGSQISQVRQSISLLTKAVDKSSDRGPGFTLAGVALKLAFMWLGRAKAALGIAPAYPEAFNVESRSIEPTTDESIDELEVPAKADATGKVKFLREQLNKIEGMIHGLVKLMKDHEAFQLAVTNALSSAAEATMWLGESLAEIRKRTPEKKEEKKEKDERKPQKVQSVVPGAFPKYEAEGEKDKQPPAPTADSSGFGGDLTSDAEKLEKREQIAPSWKSKSEEEEALVPEKDEDEDKKKAAKK